MNISFVKTLTNHYNIKKDNYWSTDTQFYDSGEDIEKTNEIIRKFGFQDG